MECEHGQLARTCDICEMERDMATLTEELARVRKLNADLLMAEMTEPRKDAELDELREQCRWRDVSVDGYPEKPGGVLIERGGKTIYGAFIAGSFWYSGEKIAALRWMPLPQPPQEQE